MGGSCSPRVHADYWLGSRSGLCVCEQCGHQNPRECVSADCRCCTFYDYGARPARETPASGRWMMIGFGFLTAAFITLMSTPELPIDVTAYDWFSARALPYLVAISAFLLAFVFSGLWSRKCRPPIPHADTAPGRLLSPKPNRTARAEVQSSW